MYTQICEYLKLLLISPALLPEINAIEQDFRNGITINSTDRNGVPYPLMLNNALEVAPLAQCDTTEPIKQMAGPYPRAFVYHIQSEYASDKQETSLRVGQHRIGISLYGSAKIPEQAEMVVSRLSFAAMKLIERNQYMFSQLPRSGGASSLAYVESAVTGMHLPASVVPFHIVLVVKVYETRNA